MLGELVFRAFITLRALWAPVSLGVNAAVFNDRGQVLLVQHRYTPGWRLPGGGVDRGEPPELAVMRELARVVRPGGSIATLEFHVPEQPLLRAGWYAYTRGALPVIGSLAGRAWRETGRFLGPSISRFDERAPLPEQVRWWQEAGVRHVRSRVMSLGAGVVVWGVKGGRGVR